MLHLGVFFGGGGAVSLDVLCFVFTHTMWANDINVGAAAVDLTEAVCLHYTSN